MKRVVIFIFLACIFSVSLFSQGLIRPNRPNRNIDPSPGFITINEINVGYGLAGSTQPYSSGFYGFSTLNAYQVNEMFLVGGGTGLLFFKEGLLVPLYVDMRLRIRISRFTPFASGAGGLLLNPSDFDKGTRMFINPTAGVRYTMNRNLGFTLGGGLWIQMGPNIGRSSFINARIGVVYKL